MDRRGQFRQFGTYALYYGSDEWQKLSRFDCAIVEPTALTREQVKTLQEQGTLVLAYISVMEARPSYECWPLLQDVDFLTDQGQRIGQDKYGTFLMDLRSRRWRGILLHNIGRYLLQAGYDGIFLDTIGDVERADIPEQPQQLEAALGIVQTLRHQFSEYIFVQNNGLELLGPKTAPYLDGIMWENPPIGQKESSQWLHGIKNRLHKLREMHSLRVLVLFEQHDNDRVLWALRRRFVDKEGYAGYFAKNDYVREVNTDALTLM